MLKILSKIILKLIGWRVDIALPDEKKFVLIGAPHTTNWDLPIGLLCLWSASIHLTWVAKKQLFAGPFDFFFRALGGIPVDRSVHTGFIEQIAHQFDNAEKMIFGLTPEGTRSKTAYWKTGFYYIALQAKVPICLAYVDYPSRTFSLGEMLYPSGDIVKDFELIKIFYQDKKGKYQKNQGPVRIRNR
jgi:1-acyl-sn-glycerol-3-phosphate acyltransferase